MNKTIKPSKQRKRIADAVYHNKRKQLIAPLDKEMQKEISKKKAVIRTKDTVKIMTGNYKGKTSQVTKINYNTGKIYLKDIKVTNSKGQEKSIPFDPSNLMITKLILEDKKRFPKKK